MGLWLGLYRVDCYNPLQIAMPSSCNPCTGSTAGLGLHGRGQLVRLDDHFLVVAGLVADDRRLLIAGPVMMGSDWRRMAVLVRLEPAVVVPAIFMLGAGIGSCWAFIAQRVMRGARKAKDVAASSVATVQQTGFAWARRWRDWWPMRRACQAGLNRTDVSRAALWVPTRLRRGRPSSHAPVGGGCQRVGAASGMPERPQSNAASSLFATCRFATSHFVRHRSRRSA